MSQHPDTPAVFWMGYLYTMIYKKYLGKKKKTMGISIYKLLIITAFKAKVREGQLLKSCNLSELGLYEATRPSVCLLKKLG